MSEPSNDPQDTEETAPAAPAKGAAVLRVLRGAMSMSLRLFLLIVIPLAAGIVGLELYVESARVVSSENAYVKANKVAVSADLAGRVKDVRVKTHDRVKAGDVLFTLDRRPLEIEAERLEAEINVVEQEIHGFQAAYRVAYSELDMMTRDLEYFNREYKRQQKLSKGGLVSSAKIDESRHSMQMARQRIRATSEKMSAALSKLGGDPEMAVQAHPSYQRAVAVRDAALFDLERTVVRAPVSGVVSRVDLQPGEYVEDGRPVFSIVEDKAVWITANLKETELTNIQLGHQATIRADAYPNFEFKGRVDSIAPATGAEFSLLPPQNASGNWVKVVQRIPVRLEIEESDNSDLLRAGMSVRIEVDTGVEPDLPAFLKTAVTLIRENRDLIPFHGGMISASQAKSHE